MSESIVITAATRTPLGAFRGALAGIPAPRLGAAAIAGALRQSEVPAARIDEVFMGCVLPAGLGLARRLAGFRDGHHHQQGLRFRHEGGHAGA
jgi:acetyl-CoA C-acetyltransferase